MAGRQKGKAYDELDFKLIKIKNKHAAFCNICKKHLSNTAEARLRAHRRCCPKTNTYGGAENLQEISIVAQNDAYADSKAVLKQEEDPFKNTKHEVTVKASSSNQIQNKEWRTFRVGGNTKHKRNVQLEDNDDFLEEITKKQRTTLDNDDVDFFFKSIALSVKKLRPELINEAKIQSLQMLFNLESKNNSVFDADREPPSPSDCSRRNYDSNIESILGEQ